MTLRSPTIAEIDEIRNQGFRPGVTSCFINNKRILFLYKKDYSTWVWSQGGIDNGETTVQSFLRETREEMGEEFLKLCDMNIMLVYTDRLEFSEHKHGVKELVNDKGEEILMKGKYYYFYAINVSAEKFDISKTEFDDYFWFDYKSALYITEGMSAKNKSKIILDVLEVIKKQGLII